MQVKDLLFPIACGLLGGLTSMFSDFYSLHDAINMSTVASL